MASTEQSMVELLTGATHAYSIRARVIIWFIVVLVSFLSLVATLWLMQVFPDKISPWSLFVWTALFLLGTFASPKE